MSVSEVTTLHQVQARHPGLICRKGVGGRYTAVTEFDPRGPVIAEGELRVSTGKGTFVVPPG